MTLIMPFYFLFVTNANNNVFRHAAILLHEDNKDANSHTFVYRKNLLPKFAMTLVPFPYRQ